MMSHIDLDKCTNNEVKQLFQSVHMHKNPNTTVNFMSSNYTLNDIEECKTQVRNALNQRAGSNVQKTSVFMQRAESLLTTELMKTSSSTHTIPTHSYSSSYTFKTIIR